MSYRIIVIGATSAGKSAITERFVLDTFVAEYGPTIDEIYQKKIEVNSKTYPLDIVDVSGLEEYNKIAEEHMKLGDGFIISYCITSRTSFTHATKVRSSLLRIKDNVPDIPIVLAANKCDLEGERTVSIAEGQKLAAEWECPFFETSAKENKNVAEVFAEVALQVDSFRARHPPVTEVVSPSSNSKRSRSSSKTSWRKSFSASSPKLNNSGELRRSTISSMGKDKEKEKEKGDRESVAGSQEVGKVSPRHSEKPSPRGEKASPRNGEKEKESKGGSCILL